MLKLYNSIVREKTNFKPIDAQNIRMYVCGPTVYDYAHIGNARPIIVFDVLFRLLRHLYGDAHVTYARNITDVDDKINQRAADEAISISALTTRTTKQFHDDIAALNALTPTIEPRATDHIDQMKTMIEELVAKGFAYVASDHVLFHVPAMSDYGQLSCRSVDDMRAGARVEVAPYKKDATDFVLWKPSKQNEPGWPSPCGITSRGRPGWHIECSAMAKTHLGDVFDIHGGGIDLIFPHHENEVAQSRCCNDSAVMANIWMHNGFLQVEGEKMSKSLGNFITIHDLLADWPGEVIRFNMLRTHYRQPIDWTLRGLEESNRILHGFFQNATIPEHVTNLETDSPVLEALCDDLNTPRTIAALHQLHGKDEDNLMAALSLLGFTGKLDNPQVTEIDAANVEAMIEQRNKARSDKNWNLADQIRDELLVMNIVIKDGPEGTSWDVKSF